jgi:hypothetical protein
VTKDGAAAESTSFEDGLGGFTAGPPPTGSEATTQRAWTARTAVGFVDGPGIQTPRSVTWGFGLEGVHGADTRAALMAGAMTHLGVLTPTAGGGAPQAAPGAPAAADVTPAPAAPPTSASAKQAAKVLAVRITRRTMRADSRGRFTVRVRCPASTSTGICRGTVRVVAGKTVIARRTFSIRADRTTTLRLTLNRAGRALLRRKASARVTVGVSTRGRDGKTRRGSARMTLRR